jgi:site-specific recombinase XerD
MANTTQHQSTEIALPNPQFAEYIEAEIVGDQEGSLRPDMMNAFEAFLQMDVAYGDPTADTIAAYRREVGFWINWCEKSGIDPAQARRGDVEAYKESLKRAGLSVATRRHKLSVIRRFYAASQKYALIKFNPAEGVKGGKDLTLPEDKMKFLAEQALAALLATIPGDNISGIRDRTLVALMAIHGLRRIEVHRLNHEDLQLEGDLAYLVVNGKGNKLRRVYLREDTFATLQTYFSAKVNAGFPAKGAVFVGHGNNGRGHRLSRQALHEIVSKYLNLAALKRSGVSCHALRHTFGTLSVAGGAKVEHVRDSMGHSKLETTSIYIKAVERAKNNPANYINVLV